MVPEMHRDLEHPRLDTIEEFTIHQPLQRDTGDSRRETGDAAHFVDGVDLRVGVEECEDLMVLGCENVLQGLEDCEGEVLPGEL